VSTGLQAVLRTDLLEAGHVLVQDEAAALVVRAALAPKRSETLLDTCAAPGGKALFAAACMHTEYRQLSDQPSSETPPHPSEGGFKGLVVAMDVNGNRVRLLHKTATLWGLEDLFVIGTCDLRKAACHTCASHRPFFSVSFSLYPFTISLENVLERTYVHGSHACKLSELLSPIYFSCNLYCTRGMVTFAEAWI
jgi:hypothetical protein